MMNEHTSEKNGPKTLFVYVALSSIIVLLGTTGYFYYQYHKLSKNPLIAQIAAQEEAKKLAVDIGKLILLPKDEVPTVATVTDISKLKDQVFFKNAANGNKVLIYPNSKLAIIYDPIAHLIVNVGPVNFSQQQAEQAQKTRIALRNGTKVVGLTNKIEADVNKSYPEVDVVLKDQDIRTDYEKTIIVILNNTSKNVAEKLAKTLKAQVRDLPDGESKPTEVDILIILGKDNS